MIFLAVAGAAAVAPCADNGYLTIVGPPGLRFASGSTRDKIAPTRFFPAETNLAQMEIPPAGNPADSLNNFPIPTNAAPVTTVVMKADSTPPPASSSALNFTSSGAAPSIVTSDMLTDFLKPAASGKNNRNNNDNSPAVVVPVNLGFTPPAAAPAVTSKAVYTSE
jgi:hypothetical protein